MPNRCHSPIHRQPRVFKDNDIIRVQILGLVKEVSKSLQ
nr:MAG TPA_asm: hypothetical protein [Bacteriophage sp.]